MQKVKTLSSKGELTGQSLFLFYLAILSMLGFVATDMYLPAFKSIEHTLSASTAQVAGSLTSFVAGLAIGQLLYGPLVQRVGKRKALVIGLSLFVIASFMAMFSSNILMFNIARFLQAIGACSAAVIWQALVIEKYNAEEAQRVFANVMPLVALSPAVAPLIGAFVLMLSSWQAIFGILVALGSLLVLLTLSLVKQDKPTASDAVTTSISYWQLIKRPQYLGNVMIFGACSGAFFSYLTLWPIVMEQHGFAAKEIGFSFIPQTAMFMVGGFLSKWLLRRVGTKRALKMLVIGFMVIITAIAVNSLVIVPSSPLPLLFIFAVLAAINGSIYPIVVNNALQVFPEHATKAAGLQNFLQMSLAFGASSLVVYWSDGLLPNAEQAIAAGILLSSIGVAIGYFIAKLTSWGQLVGRNSSTEIEPLIPVRIRK